MNPVPQLNCSQEVQDIVLLLPKINDSFAYISDNIQRKVCIKVVLLLEHLPCRAGYSAALDAAVRFVASGIRDVWIRKDDFKSGPARLSPESPEHLSLYSPAVSALRQALEDPNKSLEAETLFAAFLLCCFDVREYPQNIYPYYILIIWPQTLRCESNSHSTTTISRFRSNI